MGPLKSLWLELWNFSSFSRLLSFRHAFGKLPSSLHSWGDPYKISVVSLRLVSSFYNKIFSLKWFMKFSPIRLKFWKFKGEFHYLGVRLAIYRILMHRRGHDRYFFLIIHLNKPKFSLFWSFTSKEEVNVISWKISITV